jgi:hypothetical protein
MTPTARAELLRHAETGSVLIHRLVDAVLAQQAAAKLENHDGNNIQNNFISAIAVQLSGVGC